MKHRPDFSDYLAHFTTDRAPVSKSTSNATAHVKGVSAIARLTTILTTKKIIASKLPWNNRDAVCLTECPWGSLLDHANRYSAYGIGFNKAFIFGAGGGPAYYVRADHYNDQKWDNNVHTFVTPFWPSYRPHKLRNNGVLKDKDVDYTHEREWRVPHTLTFDYSHVEFVTLATYEDMAQFPKTLKDAIGRDKFLLMENYRNVEKLWPIHNI
jgi:hypothetical protein